MIEHAKEYTANVAMFGGSSSAVLLWGLQMSDLGVIVSMLVAVAGFVVHLHYARRRDQRAQEQHLATMELLRHGARTNDSDVDKQARRD